MTKPTKTPRRYAAGATILLALIATAIVAVRHNSTEADQDPSSRQVQVTVRPARKPIAAPAQAFPDEVVLRPLSVAHTSATHEWAEGDMSDPSVIERIAHNPDEAIRMIEENDRIKRRQLVYRNETAAAVVQQARANGEEVRQLILPGLDGQELEFVIERADLAPSGQTGTFTGHLAGMPNSQVSLGYKFGREAFTVISPDDNLYLQADPRESGELIVKAIDPQTYIQGTCGNPDHDH